MIDTGSGYIDIETDYSGSIIERIRKIGWSAESMVIRCAAIVIVIYDHWTS